MRRRNEGPGTEPESQDVERATGSTGSGSYAQSSSGATSTGMQGTGGPYQQQGTYQQGTQGSQTTSYGRGTAPQAGYGPSEVGYYDRAAMHRHGGGLAILAGSLAFLQGLAYIIMGSFYHYTVSGYAYRWNLHGWGWTLLILGALLFAGGVSTLLGLKGARHVAGAIAVITAVVAFITIFYSVIWGIVVLAACAFAANALFMDRGYYGAGAGGAGYDVGQSYQGEEAMSGQGQGSHRRM
jgi:amino acid transporter